MSHLLIRAGAFSLCLALSGAVTAQPQESAVMKPTVPPIVIPAPFVSIDVLVPNQGTILFGVNATDAEATQMLGEIATRANLQMVIRTGTSAQVARLSIKPCTTNQLIKQICQAASLSGEFHEGVWYISPLTEAEAKTKPPKTDISFADVKTVEILRMLDQGFKLKLIISPAIQSSIPYISLVGRTPRGAIDLVAEAANLEVREEGDTLIINPKPAA